MSSWLVPPAVALVVVVGLTPLVMKLARARGWLAHPTKDRWHRTPTALMGGVAIFAAASAGWAVLGPEGPLRWIWVGGGLLFLLGFLDDRRGVPPLAKLVGQLAGAGVLLWAGLLLVPNWPLWASLPLTLFWIVGITNAVNLLDNMDGLAAGISVIAAVTIAFLTWGNGQPEVAIGALVLAAASGGFLVYNFNPAKTFMGDCGSLFLGFCLAGLALTVPSTGMGRGLAGLILVPAAVMAVPILDTTLVTVKRLLVGRSIAHGGRDHTSHRLVALGLSERGAVLTLFALAAVFGLIAVGVQRLEVGLSLSLAIYATVGAAAFGAFLSTVRIYDPGTEERGRLRAGGRSESDRVLLRTFLRRRRFLLGMGVDLLLVVAAFVAAFYLRYDGTLPEPALEALIRGLPIVAVVKLVAFHLCGLHRGLWWYAGTPEIIRTILGSLLGSAGAVAALWLLLRLEGVPGSILVVDGVLTTAGLVAVRFGFRGMRGLFHGPSLDGVRPILIYGAGSRGALAVRELRRDPKGRMMPVGFLDDDPEKRGRILLGLPVLGPASEASRIASEMGVEEVLVAVSEEEGCDMEKLTSSLGANGLGLYVMSVSVRPLDGAP